MVDSSWNILYIYERQGNWSTALERIWNVVAAKF